MYGRVHQRFHRGYADMVRKSNYSDIFLVDLNGDVVYSVTKHANFAANLLSGPTSPADLATPSPRSSAASTVARSRSRSSSSPILAATNNRPGRRLPGRPVMQQYDYVRGVVIFELLPDKLNQIMAEREGSVRPARPSSSADKRMRATPPLAPGFSVENSFTPDFRPLQTPLIIKALSGEQGGRAVSLLPRGTRYWPPTPR